MTGALLFEEEDEAPLHGGTDASGVVAHDFSTNANACGPCPEAVRAIRAVDLERYPDPAHAALRERLAAFNGVPASRIVIAASASEFIGRITAAVHQEGGRRVALPSHGYGDYARAARAWALRDATSAGAADLVWCCDPSSPLGRRDEFVSGLAGRREAAVWVLDRAYEPLRLEGMPPPAHLVERAWQLWSPNKALGLCGIRAAYAIAPVDGMRLAARLRRLAPSWPLGAHGVALLEAWTEASAQRWLQASLPRLRTWKEAQRSMCASLGWDCLPGDANFFCARPDRPLSAERVAALRGAGIRLRDTASFGLPGLLRLGVRPPASQRALRRAWAGLG